jgi:Ca-activated chloride channel family protein
MESRIILSLLILFLVSTHSYGQSRHMMLRDADIAYKNKMYKEAESNYRKAKDIDNDVQSAFNLGNASYNQGKFEEAAKYFKEASSLSSNQKTQSDALFNQGNALHQAGELPAALESYKESLKLSPGDSEARENYLNTLKKLRVQQQQQQQEQKQQQEEQQQEQQEEQQQQQQQEEQQQQQQENKQEQNEAGQAEENKDKLNKEEVDKLLEMIQREEERMQEKMKGNKPNKKIIKDW